MVRALPGVEEDYNAVVAGPIHHLLDADVEAQVVCQLDHVGSHKEAATAWVDAVLLNPGVHVHFHTYVILAADIDDLPALLGVQSAPVEVASDVERHVEGHRGLTRTAPRHHVGDAVAEQPFVDDILALAAAHCEVVQVKPGKLAGRLTRNGVHLVIINIVGHLGRQRVRVIYGEAQVGGRGPEHLGLGFGGGVLLPGPHASGQVDPVDTPGRRLAARPVLGIAPGVVDLDLQLSIRPRGLAPLVPALVHGPECHLGRQAEVTHEIDGLQRPLIAVLPLGGVLAFLQPVDGVLYVLVLIEIDQRNVSLGVTLTRWVHVLGEPFRQRLDRGVRIDNLVGADDTTLFVPQFTVGSNHIAIGAAHVDAVRKVVGHAAREGGLEVKMDAAASRLHGEGIEIEPAIEPVLLTKGVEDRDAFLAIALVQINDDIIFARPDAIIAVRCGGEQLCDLGRIVGGARVPGPAVKWVLFARLDDEYAEPFLAGHPLRPFKASEGHALEVLREPDVGFDDLGLEIASYATAGDLLVNSVVCPLAQPTRRDTQHLGGFVGTDQAVATLNATGQLERGHAVGLGDVGYRKDLLVNVFGPIGVVLSRQRAHNCPRVDIENIGCAAQGNIIGCHTTHLLKYGLRGYNINRRASQTNFSTELKKFS